MKLKKILTSAVEIYFKQSMKKEVYQTLKQSYKTIYLKKMSKQSHIKKCFKFPALETFLSLFYNI